MPKKQPEKPILPRPLQEVKDNLARLAKRTYKRGGPMPPIIYGQKYYWVFGDTPKGKIVVWGPYFTHQEADHALESLVDGEVFELDTRDVSRATREIKAELAKRGKPIDDVLKRMSHKRDK